MRVLFTTLLLSQSRTAFSAPCTTESTVGSCCTEMTGTWATCLSNCNSKGKDLACPSDLNDSNDIIAECGFGWIGPNDINTENTFQCATEVAPYTHWADQEPNDANGNEDCAKNGNANTDGFWNDENCDGTNACICKDKPEPPETFSGCSKQGSGTWDQCKANCEADCATCTTEGTGNWEDCMQKCNDKDLILACPSDSMHNTAISNECGQGWIGVNDRLNEGDYMCNGEAVSFTPWWTNEPSGANEDCVETYAANTYNGRWNDVPCSSERNCICAPAPGDAGSCFHASGAATLESGASKKMSELSLGDVVQ
eukprot:CAMPEP_0171842242 /NCGR_PEP_ID=MMETSP0992-20121227/15077_1 /TAXON_ID=483369 /ORGANISM="non described non described, Strain CCMP2098" /LENGTH=311 /DNA_ID=CAMNT_0012459449 /DNA_START=59 /DNA_END=991 /DNA_ORIENTATION=+